MNTILFTDEEVDKFIQDPFHNPKTGRRISNKGRLYKSLFQAAKTRNVKFEKMNSNQIPKLIIKKIKDKQPL